MRYKLTTTATPVSQNLGMHISLTNCPSDPALGSYRLVIIERRSFLNAALNSDEVVEKVPFIKSVLYLS